MKSNIRLSIILVGLSLILFAFSSGCIGNANASSVDATAPIRISQYNQLVADVNSVGLTDGSGVLNYFKLSDLNLSGGSSAWADLTGFPSGCGVGQAVQVIGATLTCVDINAYAGIADGNVYSLGVMERDFNSFLIDVNAGTHDVYGAVVSASAFKDTATNNTFAWSALKNAWVFTDGVKALSVGSDVFSSYNPTQYITSKASGWSITGDTNTDSLQSDGDVNATRFCFNSGSCTTIWGAGAGDFDGNIYSLGIMGKDYNSFLIDVNAGSNNIYTDRNVFVKQNLVIGDDNSLNERQPFAPINIFAQPDTRESLICGGVSDANGDFFCIFNDTELGGRFNTQFSGVSRSGFDRSSLMFEGTTNQTNDTSDRAMIIFNTFSFDDNEATPLYPSQNYQIENRPWFNFRSKTKTALQINSTGDSNFADNNILGVNCITLSDGQPFCEKPISGSSEDTNWQTSWTTFDTNLKNTYLTTTTAPLNLPALDNGKYLTNNGSVLSWGTPAGGGTDTNWQTSWAIFDANMKATYNLPATAGGGSDTNTFTAGIQDKDNNNFLIDLNIYKTIPTLKLINSGDSNYSSEFTRSATNRTTTLQGTTDQQAAGLGYAAHGTYANPYIVNFGSQSPPATGTMNFWYKSDGTPTANTSPILALGDASNGFTLYHRGVTQVDKMILVPANSFGSTYTGAIGTNWHMITVTWTGTNAKFFLDTAQIDSITISSPPTATVYLGYGNVAGRQFGHTAKYEEAGMWNRVLSGAEMSTLWNGGAGLYGTTATAPYNSGLIHGWHFDEGATTSSADWAGSWTATLTNAAMWQTGLLNLPAQTGTTTFLEGKNGVATSERAIVTLGSYSASSGTKTILEGLYHYFNILGTTKGTFTTTGLTLYDNIKNCVGTASDMCITYDGTNTIFNNDVGSGQYNFRGGDLNVSGGKFINVDSNYRVGGTQGITKNMTIMQTALTTCDLNFKGGILIASTCT